MLELRTGLSVIIIFMLAIVLGILLAPVPVLIDVSIYEMEDGSFIYCATGSLTDPPARYVSQGAVPKGGESYC